MKKKHKENALIQYKRDSWMQSMKLNIKNKMKEKQDTA